MRIWTKKENNALTERSTVILQDGYVSGLRAGSPNFQPRPGEFRA